MKPFKFFDFKDKNNVKVKLIHCTNQDKGITTGEKLVV